MRYDCYELFDVCVCDGFLLALSDEFSSIFFHSFFFFFGVSDITSPLLFWIICKCAHQYVRMQYNKQPRMVTAMKILA